MSDTHTHTHTHTHTERHTHTDTHFFDWGTMVCLCPPPLLTPHFYFPLELYVYITLTINYLASFTYRCPPLKRSVVGSILLSGPSCSLGYFPFQPVVHNWFIKGRGMYCSVYGKVHIKDPLLLIEKSSLCGGSGFPSKKCVKWTI